MTEKEMEKVLCITNEEAEQNDKNGVLNLKTAVYLPRYVCESQKNLIRKHLHGTLLTPYYRQVIPYVILKKDGCYFTYKRTKKAGENRLHEQWSIGFGGHIREGEDFWEGLKREIEEELDFHNVPTNIGLNHNIQQFILLNDTEVNSLHFGVVQVFNIREEIPISIKEDELEQIGFLSKQDILQSGYAESWTQYLLEKPYL